jgi:sigma-B regulation protein RsbU (phosphoserine phosphatase)
MLEPYAVPGAPEKAAAAGMRLLAVEDDLAERMRLEHILTNMGYRVFTAGNGVEALQILEREVISLVVTDWRMPDMDGLELCRRLRAQPRYGHPYIILLTARDLTVDLVAAMDAGADDFITKPYKGEVLRVRVQAGKRILKLQAQAHAKHRALRQAMDKEQAFNQRIRADLQAAATMQAALLPKPGWVAPHWRSHTLFRPCTEVGGDIFDCFPLGDGLLAFYHIDVAGHGIPAAMLAFSLSRQLTPTAYEVGAAPAGDREAGETRSPSAVVGGLNRRFQGENTDLPHFTMVYGHVDLRTGHGRMVRAGHPPPLLLRSDGRVDFIEAGDLPVGAFPQASYTEVDFAMQPGDSLLLYSDGLTECRAAGGEQYGTRRLAAALAEGARRQPDQPLAHLEERLLHWQGIAQFTDDLSVLMLLRSPEPCSD